MASAGVDELDNSTLISTPAFALPPMLIPALQRKNKIRQMFLEYFGTGMTNRAENFSTVFSTGGPGERTEITTHQLKRYFGLCGKPAKAKVGHINAVLYLLSSKQSVCLGGGGGGGGRIDCTFCYRREFR